MKIQLYANMRELVPQKHMSHWAKGILVYELLLGLSSLFFTIL